MAKPMANPSKPKTKLTSAADLVDKPVLCPMCGSEAVVRKDGDWAYRLECPRGCKVVGIAAETSLHAIQQDEAKL